MSVPVDTLAKWSVLTWFIYYYYALCFVIVDVVDTTIVSDTHMKTPQ